MTISHVYQVTYTRTAPTIWPDATPASFTTCATVAVVDGITTEADIPALIAARVACPADHITVDALRFLRAVEG